MSICRDAQARWAELASACPVFDYHLTKKLAKLCEEHEIRSQKDIFRHYRSDAAAAEVAGHDVRTALMTFGVDASHIVSPVEIRRDKEELSGLKGFTTQPMDEAPAPVPDELVNIPK